MIELKNVTKKYGKKIVLDDVCVQFEKGKIHCLIGLNGVGKSTTMKSIMRLVPLTSGEIFVDGEKISGKNIDKIAYVADIPIYDLGWTIDQNLEFAKVFYQNFNMEKAQKLMDFLEVPRDRKLKDLSKGNLARVNLIMGLAQNAPYILLDEPFSGIDVFTREDFISSLKSKFLEEGQTVIITTHEIDEIQDLADHVVLLEEGRVYKTFSKTEAEAEGLTIMEKMRKIYRGA